MPNAALIVGIVFVLAFVLVIVVTSMLGRKQHVSTRIKALKTETRAEHLSEDEEVMLGLEAEKSGLASFCELLLRLTGTNVDKRKGELAMMFAQSGVTSPSAIDYYLFSKKFGVVIALLLGGFMVATASPTIPELDYLVAVLFLALGLFGPDLYLRNRKDKRQHLLTRSFPDALDLILVCVESGLALDAALSRVCRELAIAHPEITKELNRTRLELSLFSDRSLALQNLAMRTDLMPFRALVAALLQAEKFGTSLAETLRVLSEDYRNTRLMIAEQKAGRLPALMTIPMMLLMMPAFVMILIGPGIISLLEVLKK